MPSSSAELRQALAQDVRVSEDTLVVDLVDGRTLSVPLAWYPRLAHGSPAERDDWTRMEVEAAVASYLSMLAAERETLACRNAGNVVHRTT